MQQVPGTFSLTYTEINALSLSRFQRLLDDKVKLLERIGKGR